MAGSTHPPHSGATPSATPDDLYATRPLGHRPPQPAFAALADAGALQGRVLDVGCGTGEHAILAAGLGLDATGVDLAANALRTADDKARASGRTGPEEPLNTLPYQASADAIWLSALRSPPHRGAW